MSYRYFITDLACPDYICDHICKRGLIRAIMRIETSCFERFITVHLQNAWCLVYTILYLIQANSGGALSNGLLAELPTNLDGFYQ